VNPDTAPIAEVEEWLAPRLGWTKHPDKSGWYHDGNGMSTHIGVLIGPSMDAAIACLPPGCYWLGHYSVWLCVGENWVVDNDRSRDPAKARDELLRLAAKARAKMEEK
jgi:hypothetical protein